MEAMEQRSRRSWHFARGLNETKYKTKAETEQGTPLRGNTNQWWPSSDQSLSHPDPSEEFKTTCLAQVLTCYTYVMWIVPLFSSHTHSCYS